MRLPGYLIAGVMLFCASLAQAQDVAPAATPDAAQTNPAATQDAAPPAPADANTAQAAVEAAPVNGPQVLMQTSLGDITLQLDQDRAPLSVANFVRYVRDGHYNSTLFYRVVKGFVIQAGSYGTDGHGRALHPPIALEANNGLKNVRGAISFAHSSDPVSAQAEFFIVLADNPGLDQPADDHNNATGFAVFGHVVMGMDVVDAIAASPVGGGKGPFPDYEPQTRVVITKVSVVGDKPKPAAKAPAKKTR